LLGLLEEADEERLELRLLTEPSFIEEFDTVVDEIAAQYAHNELDPAEFQRVEKYFLEARERRVKAKFASTLIDHAANTRGRKAASNARVPTLGQRLMALLSPQNNAFKFATTVAAILVAVAIGYVALRGPSTPQNLASIELTISSSNRGEGSESKPLRLAPGTDAVRIVLHLPDGTGPYENYRVDLETPDGAKRALEITERSQRTVTAIVPARFLHGRYGLQLTGIKSDGSQERVPGTYFFTIE
jgi:hypothetical protein